jgi:hypothetical protein
LLSSKFGQIQEVTDKENKVPSLCLKVLPGDQEKGGRSGKSGVMKKLPGQRGIPLIFEKQGESQLD